MEKTNQQKQQEAVEAMNKKVGYDVPLCYATLNTIVINEEKDMGEIPLIEKRTAMAVIAEVIANTHGGRLTLDAVADIMQACIAYGWHWAREGESLLRSEYIEARLKEFLKRKVPSVLTVNEYAYRRRC